MKRHRIEKVEMIVPLNFMLLTWKDTLNKIDSPKLTSWLFHLIVSLIPNTLLFFWNWTWAKVELGRRSDYHGKVIFQQKIPTKSFYNYSAVKLKCSTAKPISRTDWVVKQKAVTSKCVRSWTNFRERLSKNANPSRDKVCKKSMTSISSLEVESSEPSSIPSRIYY